MRVVVEFVTSAAGPRDFPADGLREIALIGRSNVGKSMLINALLRQRVARTSAMPGKTRLANIFRVTRGAHAPFYLVDLPGYGYVSAARSADRLRLAQGGAEGRPPRSGVSAAEGRQQAAEEFQALMRAYFDADAPAGKQGRGTREIPAALLLVDSRHSAMEKDLEAWRWLVGTTAHRGLIGTKIDKLARGQRIRAMRELESAFDEPVLPVSAATGEGLDELWTLIDSLANPPSSNPRNRSTKATAP